MSKIKRVIPRTLYDDTYLIHNRLFAKKLIEFQEQLLLILDGDFVSVDELREQLDLFVKNSELAAALTPYLTKAEYNSEKSTFVTLSSLLAALNNYYTKTQIDAKFDNLDFNIFVPVSVLPAQGEPNKIYFIRNNESEVGNVFDEYCWINNTWEKLGSVQLNFDIFQYFTDAIFETTNDKVQLRTNNDNIIEHILDSPEYPLSGTPATWDKDSLLCTLAFIEAMLATKQDTLVDSVNIKRINGDSILGSGVVNTFYRTQLPEDGEESTFTEVVKLSKYASNGGLIFSNYDGIEYLCVATKWTEDDDSFTFIVIDENLNVVTLRYETEDSDNYICKIKVKQIADANCEVDGVVGGGTANVTDTSHHTATITDKYGNPIQLNYVSELIPLTSGQTIKFENTYYIVKLYSGDVEYTHGAIVSDDGVYTATSTCNVYALTPDLGGTSHYDILETSYTGDIQGALTYLNGNIERKESKIPINLNTQTNNGITVYANNCYTITSAVNTFNIVLGAVDAADGFVKSSSLFIKTGATPNIAISSADSKTIAYYSGFSWEANTEYELNFLFNGDKWIVSYAIIE